MASKEYLTRLRKFCVDWKTILNRSFLIQHDSVASDPKIVKWKNYCGFLWNTL